MTDDLGRLPGDDALPPKRKGLRRLRKAERVRQKQQQQQPEAQQEEETSETRKSRSSSSGGEGRGGALGDESAAPGVALASTGGGRQWDRRSWRAAGLAELAQALLGVERDEDAERSTGEDGGGLRDKEGRAGPSKDSKCAAAAAAAADVCKKEVAPEPGNKKGAGKARAKQADAAKQKASAAVEAAAEEEDPLERAKRLREERREGVGRWAQGLRVALETETHVTTAHRVAAATRDAIILELADRTKVTPEASSGRHCYRFFLFAWSSIEEVMRTRA